MTAKRPIGDPSSPADRAEEEEPSEVLSAEEIALLLRGRTAPHGGAAGTGENGSGDTVDDRQAADRRGADRVDLHHQAHVEIAGAAYPCAVADLSARGAMLLFKNDAREGDPVTVRIPGIEPLDGVIIWRTPVGLGVRWVREISDVARLISTLSAG